MKKVLLCIPTLGTGGAEKFVVDLAIRLEKSGFAVTIAITRRKVTGIYEQMLKGHQIPVVDLSGDHYFSMLRKQMAYLKKERPDVVHTNIGSVLHMMLATKLIPVPVKLFTIHNQAEYTLGEKKRNKWIYKMAFSIFGYTPVAICDHIAKSWEEGLGIKSKRFRKVCNGVDTVRFVPANRLDKGQETRIITVGTIYKTKNHIALLDAFYRLYQNNPALRLIILGDGVLRPELERRVREFGLTEIVSMPGIQKDVCSYLQKADLYVSASEAEGLPLSILEAMACGLPIVATDVGGTSEIVHDGENGIVVPKGDSAALEKAMEELVADAQMRKEYGEASLRIVQDWSIEACVRGYEALYVENR